MLVVLKVIEKRRRLFIALMTSLNMRGKRFKVSFRIAEIIIKILFTMYFNILAKPPALLMF